MEPQSFLLKNKCDFSEMWMSVSLYVNAVYPGSEWQDVCLSGFTLLTDKNRAELQPTLPGWESIVEWENENGRPVKGIYSGDHDKGEAIVIYDGDRVKQMEFRGYLRDWKYRELIICEYIYEGDKVTVYDREIDKRLREYVFENGKLKEEHRFVNNREEEEKPSVFLYDNGAESPDTRREYIVENNGTLRFDYEYSGYSEGSIYQDGILVKTFRDAHEDYLLPVEFLKF
jgi:hypothetical protein